MICPTCGKAQLTERPHLHAVPPDAPRQWWFAAEGPEEEMVCGRCDQRIPNGTPATYVLAHADQCPTPAETGLDELRALSDAATEGPWRVGKPPATADGIWSDTATGYDHEEGEQVYLVAWCHGDWRADEDAAFIVAAVNYLRAALSNYEDGR